VGRSAPSPPEGQHGPPPRAATSRATAAGSALTGTRRTSPVGRTTAAVGSGTTRTGANVGAGGVGAGPGAARALPPEEQGAAVPPGGAGGRAHAVGGAEGGNRLARDLPAGDEVAPEGLGLRVAAGIAGHRGGFRLGERAPIVPDLARRPHTGRLRRWCCSSAV